MSDKIVIYNDKENRLVVLVPSTKCGLTLEQIAKKDVPTGTKYKIVDRSFLPSDGDFRNAWEISESELTDGVGD
jgi:hypothetical protein|tara:strand:- start:252 stop:473 length:222 start_codon:yes stop_codon:yes gene_type:complete